MASNSGLYTPRSPLTKGRASLYSPGYTAPPSVRRMTEEGRYRITEEGRYRAVERR